MRAREFLDERKHPIVKNGLKPERSAEFAMPGAHRVAGTADKTYDLSRIMQMVAGTDGKTMPPVSDQSWVGRNNTAHPYTKIEADMLKKTYKSLGLKWDDAIKPNPDNKSREHPHIDNTSPIKSFKGYPR